MWSHNPNTKTKRITLSKNINYDIPHGTANNLNISNLRINQDHNFYQPHNKREINKYDNQKIYNTPYWKRKNEGELK